MKIHLYLLNIMLLTAVWNADAQSLHKPTPAENAVLVKMINAITNSFDNFNSNDWEKTNDYYDDDPYVSSDPDVPLDINENFQRDYEARNESSYFDRFVKPLDDKVTDFMQNQQYDSIEAIGKKIKQLSKFSVYAYVNRENISIHPGDSLLVPFTVSGCNYACLTQADQYGNNTDTYWLLFGNWDKAKWDDDHDWLHYHFIYPPQTPFIENVVILIVGDNDYMKKVIQKTDWSAITKALTF